MLQNLHLQDEDMGFDLDEDPVDTFPIILLSSEEKKQTRAPWRSALIVKLLEGPSTSSTSTSRLEQYGNRKRTYSVLTLAWIISSSDSNSKRTTRKSLMKALGSSASSFSLSNKGRQASDLQKHNSQPPPSGTDCLNSPIELYDTAILRRIGN